MKRHAIVVMLACGLSAQAMAVTYLVTDLGVLPGGETSDASAINRRGQVVGTAPVDGVSRAYLFTDGVMTDLGSLGGNRSSAEAVNARGEVVGTAETAQAQSHAFWYRHGAMLDLGTLGGFYSSGKGLNSVGGVVGESTLAGGEVHAFSWANGVMQDLGTLGGERSAAYDINDAGQAVGWANRSGSTDTMAVIFEAGGMTELGTLGGGQSAAFAINRWGQVTGGADTPDGHGHAFLYSNGVMQDLGVMPNFQSCAGLALNNRGHVVGMCFKDDARGSQPFVSFGGPARNLNKHLDPVTGEGWQLKDARGINDEGQIIGMGRLFGVRRAYLLTPVDGL